MPVFTDFTANLTSRSTPKPKPVSPRSPTASDIDDYCNYHQNAAEHVAVVVMALIIFGLLISTIRLWKQSKTDRRLAEELKRAERCKHNLARQLKDINITMQDGPKTAPPDDTSPGHSGDSVNGEKRLRFRTNGYMGPVRAPPPDHKQRQKEAELYKKGVKAPRGPRIEDIEWAAENQFGKSEENLYSAYASGEAAAEKGKWSARKTNRDFDTQGFTDIPLCGKREPSLSKDGYTTPHRTTRWPLDS